MFVFSLHNAGSPFQETLLRLKKSKAPVIARSSQSVATKQSQGERHSSRLPRHYVPRNDKIY